MEFSKCIYLYKYKARLSNAAERITFNSILSKKRRWVPFFTMLPFQWTLNFMFVCTDIIGSQFSEKKGTQKYVKKLPGRASRETGGGGVVIVSG